MTAKHNILIVDDDPDDREMLRYALAKIANDCEITEAEDGEMALEKLGELHRVQQLPCLIVMDINMPGMDGRKTISILKKSPLYSHIPVVVFTTAYNEHPDDSTLVNPAAYFVKPLRVEELQETAKKMIRVCSHSIVMG